MMDELESTSKEELLTTAGPEVVAVEKASADTQEVASSEQSNRDLLPAVVLGPPLKLRSLTPTLSQREREITHCLLPTEREIRRS